VDTIAKPPHRRWRARRLSGLILATCVSIGLGSCGAEEAPPLLKVIAADQRGSADTSFGADGTTYRVTFLPGTLSPRQQLLVTDAATLPPDLSGGKPVTTPLRFTSPLPPTLPGTLEIDGLAVPDALTLAALWGGAGDPVELVPLRLLDNGKLGVELPRLGSFGIFQFPSVEDVGRFIETNVIGPAIRSLTGFFNAPYDCPPAAFSSQLVESINYPVTTHLQVDISDVDVASSIVKINICNKLRFPLTYSASDVAQLEPSLALPRSSLDLTSPLRGKAGTRFSIDADLTPEAVTTTLMFLAFEVVPGGHGIVEQAIKKNLLSSKAVTYIANSARACGSEVDAAADELGADRWQIALNCLSKVQPFLQAMVEIGVEAGAKKATLEAALSSWQVKIILGGHAVNRLVAEFLLLKPASHLTFQYRLLCRPGERCGRADPPSSPVRKELGERKETCAAGQHRNAAGNCESERPHPQPGSGGRHEPARIDLEVVKLQPHVGEVCVGTGRDLTALVRNNGTAPSDSYAVDWSIAGTVFSGTRPGLDAGATDDAIGYTNWTPTEPGAYVHELTVDTGSEIAELDETNNSGSLEITAVDCSAPVVPPCPADQERDGSGTCVLPPCPVGQERDGSNTCVLPPCPTGEERDAAGDCVPVPCPEGTVRTESGQCIPFGKLGPGPTPSAENDDGGGATDEDGSRGGDGGDNGGDGADGEEDDSGG
jgi:hypothetical protein